MNIYLVKRTEEIDWDEVIEFVVIAETPHKARRLIITSSLVGEEGPSAWMASSRSSCTTLGTAAERFSSARIVSRSKLMG